MKILLIQLIANKDLWLKGGAPYVNVVFITKYSKTHDNCMEGNLEVFRKTGACGINMIIWIIQKYHG